MNSPLGAKLVQVNRGSFRQRHADDCLKWRANVGSLGLAGPARKYPWVLSAEMLAGLTRVPQRSIPTSLVEEMQHCFSDMGDSVDRPSLPVLFRGFTKGPVND